MTKDYIKEFQFHKGTIRTQDIDAFINDNINFNSIKVRLELETLLTVLSLPLISIP